MSVYVNSKPKSDKPDIKPFGQQTKLNIKPVWSGPRFQRVMNLSDSMLRKGFSPHRNPLDIQLSRDHVLDNFVCKATKCIANRGGLCISPSLCKIGEDGCCMNHKERK